MTNDLSLLKRREQLLNKKGEVDAQISRIQLTLDTASARFHQTGKGLPTDSYFKFRAQLMSLKRESQTLQGEIGNIGRQIRNGECRTLGELFIEVARVSLDHNKFHDILRSALAMRNGEK